MHVDHYSFGRIVIEGKTYTSDVIVYSDRVDSSWWRREGHYLQEEDLSGVVAAEPEEVVIGTGNSGVMDVPEHTVRFLEAHGMKVYVARTAAAVEFFNARSGKGKVVGAFHLTC